MKQLDYIQQAKKALILLSNATAATEDRQLMMIADRACDEFHRVLMEREKKYA